MTDLTPEIVQAKVLAHEEVCAERYRGISEKLVDVNAKITEVKRMLTWAAITMFGLFISVLGWSLQQQYAAMQSSAREVAAQIQLLRAAAPPSAASPQSQP